jgi:hypothetical protein
MAYTVNKSNGAIAKVVQDYKKEIVGGLSLMGYGFVNYGEEIAENFVAIAENFASQTAPTNPVEGQIWYKLAGNEAVTGAKHSLMLYVRNGSNVFGWKELFSVLVSTGDVIIDADTLDGFDSSKTSAPNTVVVRDSSGKIDSASINFPSPPTSVAHSNVSDQATSLVNTRTFGSRSGGLPFNGTQNVPLTTSHIGEGDQLYYTDSRAIAAARSAISASGNLSYNPATGVMTYNAPPVSASVTSFNGRSGTVSLTSGDVTNALGYVPVNKAGDQMTGRLVLRPGQNYGIAFPADPFGGAGDFASFTLESAGGDATGPYGAGEKMRLRIRVSNDAGNNAVDDKFEFIVPDAASVLINNAVVWNAGFQGPGTGMNADLLDGKHATDIINEATAGVSGAITGQGTNWVTYNNGLKMCWGKVAVPRNSKVTFNFPFTFNVVPTMVAAGTDTNGGDPQLNDCETYTPGITTSQGAVTNGRDGALVGHWFAIGF